MSIDQEVEVLSKIPLFANIAPAKLKLMAFASELPDLQAGTSLFHQGDDGDSAFIVLDGKAAVVVDFGRQGNHAVELGKNDIVARSQFSATYPDRKVVARSELTVLRITKDLFFRLVKDFPEIGMRSCVSWRSGSNRPPPSCAQQAVKSRMKAGTRAQAVPLGGASRLDDAIAYYRALIALLDEAADAVAELDSPVLVIGLGNGRSLDHLREKLPDRRFLAFDRQDRAIPEAGRAEPDLFLASAGQNIENALAAWAAPRP